MPHPQRVRAGAVIRAGKRDVLNVHQCIIAVAIAKDGGFPVGCTSPLNGGNLMFCFPETGKTTS